MNRRTKIIGGVVIIVVVIVMAIIVSVLRDRPVPYPEVGYDQMMYGGEAPEDFSISAISSRGEKAYEGLAVADVEEEVYTANSTERLIIKTGTFSMVVDDVGGAVQAISDYAVQKGGFLVSSNIYRTGVAPYATVVVRVPATVFDEGVEEFKKMGEVKSESVDGLDVTEEYVDLEAQLNNLQATESQFLEIMKKAYEIEDILAVQRELTNVRDRIERIKGRMKYLRTSSDLSTITVHLSTDPEVLPIVDDEDKWKPWGEVKEALRSLLDMAKAFSYLVIWVAVYIPLWIAIAIFGWIVYRIIKRVLRGKKQE